MVSYAVLHPQKKIKKEKKKNSNMPRRWDYII